MSDDNLSLDSEWNEAKAYFYRIHLTLMAANDASLRHDHSGHFDALVRLHTELVAQMSEEPEQKGEMETKAEQLKTMCERFLYSKNPNIDQRVLTSKLFDYERHLRFIMKIRKMDMPRKRDPKRALMDG